MQKTGKQSLTVTSLQAWLVENAESALNQLAAEADSQSQDAVTKDAGLIGKIVDAFGADETRVRAVLGGLQDALVAAGRSGSSGFGSYGSLPSESRRRGGHRAGASLGRFQFARWSRQLEDRIDELTAGRRFSPRFAPPDDIGALRHALREDLADVPVLGPGGEVIDIHQKIMMESLLTPEQKERIFDVLAEVRAAYMRIDADLAEGDRNKGYQIVNWKHTRGEIDQTLEAAKVARSTGHQLEDSILASIFSDAVKTPENFITHNLDGAQAAAEVLIRYLDPSHDVEMGRIEGIVHAIHEHQIGPPKFMSMMVGSLVRRWGAELSPDEEVLLAAIEDKIAGPFSAPKTEDGSGIAFTPDELKLLERIGVESWAVPNRAFPHFFISSALIDGDSLINYASPDGWAKFVAIRGPNTFFQDETVWGAIASCEDSYADAVSVISDRARPIAEAGVERTRRAVDRVKGDVQGWIDEQSGAGHVPFTKDGKVAFWNAPLRYPPDNGALSEDEQAQFEFALQIRERVADGLRAQQGVY